MSRLLIVAGVDQTCVATPRGLRMAQEMDLQPELVGFTYTNIKRLKVDAATGANIKKKLLAARRAELNGLADKYAAEGQKVKVNAVWAEDIHPWIIKRATDDYTAVVKGRHQSETFVHVSTDWHLLRECSVPVLLVGGRKKWKKSSPILATVDLDATAKAKKALNLEVLQQARHYAEIFDTELQVLCVIDVPTLLADLDLVDVKTWAADRKKALQPVLKELADQAGLPTSVFRFKRGPVAKTIVSEAAECKAQLVVMGTVGRAGVKGQVIGNTAEAVLGLINSDTLTLKP